MFVSSLKKILQKEYFRSILIPLIVIETMLVIAYFWSNTYVNEATQRALVEETKLNVEEISYRAAKIIDTEFTAIASLTQVFADEHTRFFQEYDPKN